MKCDACDARRKTLNDGLCELCMEGHRTALDYWKAQARMAHEQCAFDYKRHLKLARAVAQFAKQLARLVDGY